MFNCPFCNEELIENTKFCPTCGKDVSKPALSLCSSCGVKLIPGKKFCHKCGAPVKEKIIHQDENKLAFQSKKKKINKSSSNTKFPIPAVVVIVVIIITGIFLFITWENKHIKKGKELAKTGNYQAAIGELETGFQEEPKNDNAPSLIARCYLNENDYFQAITWSKKALAINRENKEAKEILTSSMNYAMDMMKDGEKDNLEAEKIINQIDGSKIWPGYEEAIGSGNSKVVLRSLKRLWELDKNKAISVYREQVENSDSEIKYYVCSTLYYEVNDKIGIKCLIENWNRELQEKLVKENYYLKSDNKGKEKLDLLFKEKPEQVATLMEYCVDNNLGSIYNSWELFKDYLFKLKEPFPGEILDIAVKILLSNKENGAGNWINADMIELIGTLDDYKKAIPDLKIVREACVKNVSSNSVDDMDKLDALLEKYGIACDKSYKKDLILSASDALNYTMNSIKQAGLINPKFTGGK